jgi:uncharacterized protein (TIGR02594 family)
MTTKQVWIKSDEIDLDTSNAPWMKVAESELGKKVHELAANDEFITEMRRALTLNSQFEEALNTDSLLPESKADARVDGRYKLLSKKLADSAQQALGKMEAVRLKERNPEIAKYLKTVKTDPAYDAKGRSFEIEPTFESVGFGKITAWCAAFVNWCLSQANAPHLGYATAKSWLEFGTPVAHPVYGCITIVKPSSSTGSTTGHVAFFVEPQGDHVVLLGGNQHHGAVSEDPFKESTVLGYRWPTKINHYLLATTGVLA